MLDNNFFNANLPTNQNDIELRLDQAWTYINERKVPLAQQACQNINQDFPKSADGWYAASFLAFQLKQLSVLSIKRLPYNLIICNGNFKRLRLCYQCLTKIKR